MAIAQLTGNCPVMNEIIKLGNIETKVNQIIEEYLSFDLSPSLSGMLPSLVWSFTALDWNLQHNEDFWNKALKTMMTNQTALTFSAKVLLS